MQRLACGILVLTLNPSLMTAVASGQDKPATPAEQYKALFKEYATASSSGAPMTDAERLKFVGRAYRQRFALAVAGFQKNLWLAAVGLAGHGVFDFVHHLFIRNPGVPEWWPGFCGSFDVLAGGVLALLLMQRSRVAPQVRTTS